MGSVDETFRHRQGRLVKQNYVTDSENSLRSSDGGMRALLSPSASAAGRQGVSEDRELSSKMTPNCSTWTEFESTSNNNYPTALSSVTISTLGTTTLVVADSRNSLFCSNTSVATSAINNITMVDNMADHGVIDKDTIDNQAKDNIVKVKNGMNSRETTNVDALLDPGLDLLDVSNEPNLSISVMSSAAEDDTRTYLLEGPSVTS